MAFSVQDFLLKFFMHRYILDACYIFLPYFYFETLLTFRGEYYLSIIMYFFSILLLLSLT